ncbi:MAG: branched-chain amino acid ABC transporter permease [Proteobacteria bacterium]|nr:MAG: branched-chain amino acid ABC transporter permease [Pseudomonadota bacterium]QKK12031.1 MAG: branched-chain amino acid ABC transporter permease [Pseudomonadota bacterium]
MPFDFYINILVAGVLNGTVYGLMALGLSVIFGVMRIVNFAHGEMMVMGMYAAFMLNVWLGVDPLVALPFVALALFAFGFGLQTTIINRFINVPEHQQFLLLLAVGIILTNAMILLFGPDARAIQVSYAFDSIELGVLVIDKVRIYAAGTAAIIAALLFGFFRYTRMGKAIRACADNFLGAQVIGLNIKLLYAVTFGIGAACVGAAGTLIVMLVDVHPHLAVDFTLLAFVIVIVGGLGSLSGALIGGILVGVAETLPALLTFVSIPPSMKSMFSFALLILILLVRPQGLLGKKA